jgi:hypothetical protein
VVRRPILTLVASLVWSSGVSAQSVEITGVSVSRLGKANLCSDLGGRGEPPSITVRHSKAQGTISIAMRDRLSNGSEVNHGSVEVAANPSGTTIVRNNFLPPCNRITGQGVTSAYWVTVAAGASTRTVLWGRYP